MIDFIKKALTSSQQQEPGAGAGAGAGASREDDLRTATCALFLEMANIDDEFSDEERNSILTIIQTEYLWGFTNLINDNYTEDEKLRVVELLWRVVYVDGKMDKHEDYLIHKVAKLLRLTHKQMITAKLRVLGNK
jgi:uncharacterized tellurite resistance protein B-like protein